MPSAKASVRSTRQPLPGHQAPAGIADADDLKGHVRESRKKHFSEVRDGLAGKTLTYVGITVGAAFHEERDDRIGIVTVPGLGITFYNLNGVHSLDFCGILERSRTSFTRPVIALRARSCQD